MSTTKVAPEQAETEVTNWLDYKQIDAAQREASKENIEALVKHVANGTLVVKEDFTLVQTLKFPIGADGAVKQLEYKPRLSMKQLKPHLVGVKATDLDGRVEAYAAALTNKPKTLLAEMDTTDASVIQAIVVFFV